MSAAFNVSETSNTSSDLVTVVIPFYSHPEYLPQALESALGQTYPHLEILVVDDGSPHDPASIMAPYLGDTRVRMIRQVNQGVAAARNTGIQASQGAYLQFLDTDDYLAPEKIATHVRALEAEPELGLVFCPFRYVEGNTISEPVNPLHDPHWQAEDNSLFYTLWAANRMVLAGPLARREWIERAGGFNTANLTEDYELWLRLAALGCKMRNLPDALVYYRLNEQGRSQDGRARARKVATRAAILSRFPELSAEATERAMETWSASFEALWRSRQEAIERLQNTIDRQQTVIAGQQETIDGQQAVITGQQATIDQQASDLAEAKQRWDGLHTYTLKLQETIDRQTGDLLKTNYDFDQLRHHSEEQQEIIDKVAKASKSRRLDTRLKGIVKNIRGGE